jgi:hypothetical protein
MNTNLRTATIAAALVTALSYGTNSNAAKSPPPPPPEPYNPQILYTELTQGGRTTTIYVANADGTDAVALYSTGNITSQVKFAPTNRIVFIEQNTLKVLSYAVSSQGVTTTNVATLTGQQPYNTLRLDVSPDGTELLFTEDTGTPNQTAVWLMSISGGTPHMLSLLPGTYFDAVWAHSNSRIAVLQGAPVDPGFGVQTIQIVDLDASYNFLDANTVFTTAVSPLYAIQRIESAHTSDTVVFGAASASSAGVYTVDFTTMATPILSAPIVAGSSASFSADDSTILFVGPTTPILYELNLNTEKQTLVNTPRLFAQPDFLP